MHEENEDAEPHSMSDAEWEESVEAMDPETAATLHRWADEEARARSDRARRLRLKDLTRPVARRRSRVDEFSDEGAAAPLSVRLPRWLDEQIRREFQQIGVSPSEALRQILEEWWVARRYPALEYRDAAFLRVAAIRNGPDMAEWISDPRRCRIDPMAEEQAADYAVLARIRIEARARAPFSAK